VIFSRHSTNCPDIDKWAKVEDSFKAGFGYIPSMPP
jgi:hypothetical protein